MRVLVVGAMASETAGLRRRLINKEEIERGGVWFVSGWLKGQVGVEFYVVHSGVGEGQAEEFAIALAHCGVEFDHLVIVGLCGGLDPALKSGCLVVSKDVYDEVGSRCQSTLEALPSDADSEVRHEIGTLLTSSVVLTTPELKQATWELLGSPVNAVVDMETFTIVSLLDERGVLPSTVVSLRAVSDTATESLPEFLAGLDDAEWLWVYWEIAKFLLRDPRGVKVLWRLYWRLRGGG